ncbi:MAG: DUF222 domain-containing protein [Nocardioides sp.]|nr:DUF222 domain-containing protein [Nocardioides sp.]
MLAWVEQLAASAGPDNDKARVEMLGALERLVCAATGLQADVAADLDTSVRRVEADHGVPTDRQGRGVAAEVALACRESPRRGRQRVGLGRILRDEMPCTRRALRAGRTTGWKATILARETASLSLADRQAIDRRLAADTPRLEKMGDRQLEGAARGLASELDPAACVLRRRIAESERRVTLRPAPDIMSRLSTELPVAKGVAVFKALSDVVEWARAGGDPRTRGQVMADTLVGRVLGAADGVVPVEVGLVVSDEVLFGTRDDSAHLDGYGPIPAELARELAGRAAAHDLAGLRRLYRRPSDGQLVAMDSRSRRFRGGLARFIRLCDRVCRTPWCDAPIRHTDHPEPAAHAGETSDVNGQCLCEQCNDGKEAPGWRVRPVRGDPHTIEIRTPTGRVYRSQAPAAPGRRPQRALAGGEVPRLDRRSSLSVSSIECGPRSRSA